MNLPNGLTFLASLIEIISIYGIFFILCDTNQVTKFKLVFYALANTLLATVLNHCLVPWHFVFMILSYVILLKLFTRNTVKHIFVDIVAANACFFVIQFLLTIVFSMFRINLAEQYALVLGLLIGIGCTILFIAKNKKALKKIRTAYEGCRDITFFTVVNCFFTITILLQVWNSFGIAFFQEKWYLVGLVCINLVLNVSLFILIKHKITAVWEAKTYKDANQYLQERTQAEAAQRHEYRNNLQTLVGIAYTLPPEESVAAIIAYCKQQGQQQGKTSKEETGSVKSDLSSNVVLEAVLFEKITKARETGIYFRHQIGTLTLEQVLPPHKLSELLHNLLNNAFEAVQKLPEEEREVNLIAEGTCIQVLNTLPEEVDEVAISKFLDRGYSTKSADRGYGLPNVSNILTEYGGVLRISRKGSLLCVKALF